MPTRGIKRKFPEWEESVLDGQLSFQADSYYFFRQSLLNMSLEKFNKGRMMVEPSLRRYVLIANTLRVIQDDMCHERPCPPALDGGLPAAYESLSGNVVGSLPPDLENILLPSIEDDFSVSAAIATILKELESVLDESCPQRPFVMPDPEAKLESNNQAGLRVPLVTQSPSSEVQTTKEGSLGEIQEIELIKELVLATACTESLPAPSPVALPEPSSPMDTSDQEPATAKGPLLSIQEGSVESSLSNQESLVVTDTSRPEPIKSDQPTQNSAPNVPTEELKSSEAVFGSFEIMNSSYLNDVSFDDPFSDIDTSVFEKETTSVGSSIRLSASEELWFPSACNSSSFSSSQGMRDPNDLDNIIEILVGS